MTDYDINDEKSLVAVNSANPNNIIFLNKNGLKYTLDNGNTILNSSGSTATNNDISTSVFSAFRTITSDRSIANVFYYYDWDGSFFKSTNGGMTWLLQNNNDLPSSTDAYQKAKLISIPDQPNHLWFNLQKNLYRSTNGGSDWIEIQTVESVIALGNGIGENVGDYDALYFYGKLTGDSYNYYYRSTDEGISWTRINDHSEKELWNSANFVMGDRNTFGTVYVSASGQGVKHGNPAVVNSCVDMELLIDGEFNDINSTFIPNWTFNLLNGAVATESINQWDNAIIDIVDGGSFEWDVQLWQDDIEIVQGNFYLLTSRLESDADRTITIKLRNKPNGAINYIEELIPVTTTKKNHSILFQAPVNDNDVRLTLLMGADDNSLNIDKVSFTEYCSEPNVDDLNCDDFIYLKSHILLNDEYKSAEFLKSDGSVIQNSSTSFKAESEILLMPDFNVDTNADFEAVIEDCD